MTVAVPIYIAVIAIAEAIGAFIGVIPSVLTHSILIPVLLAHYVYAPGAPYRRVLPALLVVPLLRILSLTMPIQQVPQLYWPALVGIPLLVAVALTARLLDLPGASLGLHIQARRPQVLIALSGLPLSVAAFLILRPQPLTNGFDWFSIITGSVILMIFTGFTEELIFRGLLQQVAHEIVGHTAVLYSSILFAVMYIGSLSLSYVFFIGLVGLFFGYCVNKSGSIWGVILAHGIMNIGLVFVWPLVTLQ